MLTTLLPAAALLALAVYLIGEVVTQPERERRALVRRAARYGGQTPERRSSRCTCACWLRG